MESADALGERVNKAIGAHLDRVAEFMRPIQRDAYKCAYEVYADSRKSLKDVGPATERCFEPVEKGQQVMQSEMSNIQV